MTPAHPVELDPVHIILAQELLDEGQDRISHAFVLIVQAARELIKAPLRVLVDHPLHARPEELVLAAASVTIIHSHSRDEPYLAFVTSREHDLYEVKTGGIQLGKYRDVLSLTLDDRMIADTERVDCLAGHHQASKTCKHALNQRVNARADVLVHDLLEQSFRVLRVGATLSHRHKDRPPHRLRIVVDDDLVRVLLFRRHAANSFH